MKKPKKVNTTFFEYTIKEQLGEGGSGVVYKAVEKSGKAFAIKFLKDTSPEKIKRFKNEYRFCRQNAHKNIIISCDDGRTSEDHPFIVMPLYESSLRSIMEKIEPEQAYQFFLSIIDGVEFAHSKDVVHRDIKPENILINSDDLNPVIADFGIARFFEEDLYTTVDTKPATRLANFQYAAPEQRKRGATIDHPADIFALGLLLNELFTGEVPLGDDYITIKSVASGYAFLDPIVKKMIQQKPQNRYNSIKDVKDAISQRGKYDWIKIIPFNIQHSAIHFSDDRLRLSFPGGARVQWFDDRKKIIDRLEKFFRPPLDFHEHIDIGIDAPIWWHRGSRSSHIRKFGRIDDDVILLNNLELLVRKIAVVRDSYYNSYIYLEMEPMPPIDKKPENIQMQLEYGSYSDEAYGLYKGNTITYSECEDTAAEINGKLIELDGSQETRIRYLTPYNLLIVPMGSYVHLGPKDESSNDLDEKIEDLLDGLLNGTKKFDELQEFISELPKPNFLLYKD